MVTKSRFSTFYVFTLKKKVVMITVSFFVLVVLHPLSDGYSEEGVIG